MERSDREGLKTFAELMKITGERDGFLTRDISYFENIYDALHEDCLLYTSDAADDTPCVDLGGRRIIKK
ncbi:hypothetical protein JMUB7554_27920 [Staphylococcus aureus]